MVVNLPTKEKLIRFAFTVAVSLRDFSQRFAHSVAEKRIINNGKKRAEFIFLLVSCWYNCENDYTLGLDGLPKADVLKFIFKDSSWIAIRPSGTEPKIKVYYSVRGENKDDASKVLEARRAIISKLIEN